MHRCAEFVAAASTFVAAALFIAQPNLITPFIPAYERALGLGDLGPATLLVAYLVTLIPTMTFARPKNRVSAARLLMLALVIGLVSDAVMVLWADSVLVLFARALTGAAIGLGTGAASVILLEIRGESARTAIATTNSIGGLCGTVIAASIATISPDADWVVFAAHGTLVALVVVTLRVLRNTLHRGPRTTPVTRVTADPEIPLPSNRSRALPSLSGVLGWGAAATVVTFSPLAVSSALPNPSPILLALPATVSFAVALIVQLFIRVHSKTTESIIGAALIAAGFVCIATGQAHPHLVPLLIGTALVGGGQGLSFRGGLRQISGELRSGAHGRAVTLYSARAYGGTAGLVVTIAAFSNLFGSSGGSLLFAALAAVTLIVRSVPASNPTYQPTRT